MADIWLPGFQRIPNSHAGGGSFVANYRPRWTGHTTEVITTNPARAAGNHPTPPHCWVTLPSHPHVPRFRGQMIPLNRSAFALKHNVGDPETNKAGAIQVEIEGYSVDAGGWSHEDLDWLADNVVGPMCEATGVKPAIVWAGNTRMSWSQWSSFNGLHTHRNVPGNTHTDAPIDLNYISQRLLSGSPTPPPSSPGEPMPAMFQHPDGRWEIVIIDTADGNKIKTRWQTTPGVTPWPQQTFATINTPGLSNQWDPTTFSGFVDHLGIFNWTARNLVNGKWYQGWFQEAAPAGWQGPVQI